MNRPVPPRSLSLPVALCLAGLGLASPTPAAPAHAPAPAARGSAFDGHWEAELKGDARVWTFTLDLLARGDTLTGSVGVPSRDMDFPITRGKIAGNRISFVGAGLWSGTLVGNDLRLVRELDGGKKQSTIAHRKPKAQS